MRLKLKFDHVQYLQELTVHSIKFLNTKQKFYYKWCAAVQLLIREGCICKLTFYLPEALS